MSDSQVSVAQLRSVVEQFVAQRDWQSFHTPKNLVMAMSVEMAELMEHFQWLTPEQALAVKSDSGALEDVRHEIADVACYLFALCNAMEIDLSDAVTEKMKLNRIKYPAPE